MIKKITACSAPDPSGTEEKKKTPLSDKKRFADHLTRNLALSGMLILAVAAVRGAGLPNGQTVQAAVRQLTDPSWDESLGKITARTAPCFGAVTHAWSEGEPYVGYSAVDRNVFAAADGQVMSLAHGVEEEYVIRIRHENGLETLYYGLAEALVREGDPVTDQTCLGYALSPDGVFIEVMRSGRADDPTGLLLPRSGDRP